MLLVLSQSAIWNWPLQPHLLPLLAALRSMRSCVLVFLAQMIAYASRNHGRGHVRHHGDHHGLWDHLFLHHP